MKSSAAISTDGIITLGHEAQPIINRLSRIEQNKLFSETATRIADFLETEVAGLIIHRDETALHAHYKMPAFNRNGMPLSKVITPTVAKKLQDIAGEVWGAHGITRGKSKAQRIIDKDLQSTINHRSVKQLHEDLPREIDEAKLKIQKLERLIVENQQKLELGRGDEEKIQKRIGDYGQRIENIQIAERDLESKQREIEAKETKIGDGEKMLLTQFKAIKKAEKELATEQAEWKSPGARFGALFGAAVDGLFSAKTRKSKSSNGKKQS